MTANWKQHKLASIYPLLMGQEGADMQDLYWLCTPTSDAALGTSRSLKANAAVTAREERWS